MLCYSINYLYYFVFVPQIILIKKKSSNDKNGQANISYVTKQSEGYQV